LDFAPMMALPRLERVAVADEQVSIRPSAVSGSLQAQLPLDTSVMI